MSNQKQVRVNDETHQHIRIMAAAAKMPINEYIETVFNDEWAAFQRSEVQYELLRRSARKERQEKND